MVNKTRKKVDIKTRSIGSIVKESYINYGTYVNTSRHMPLLYDGLKPSYRKTLYSALKVAGKDHNKAAAVLGEVVKYYPHGSQHIEPILNNLAQYGIMADIGNNGRAMMIKSNIPAAASRYLDVQVDPTWYELFSELLQFVPYEVGEFGYKEPSYLPTPLPLGLIFGYSSMSCGANTDLAPFTPTSLMEAVTKDDPDKLQLSFGMILDKKSSNLHGIYHEGSGKIEFKYSIEKGTTNGMTSWTIVGNPVYSKPAINNTWLIDSTYPTLEYPLSEMIQRGWIEGFESVNGMLNVVTLVLRNKAIDEDTLESYLKDTFRGTKNVKITITDGEKVGRIGIKEWVNYTLNNYYRLIEEYRDYHINKLEYEKELLISLPKVVEVLIQHRDWEDEQISKESGIRIEIVKDVMKRSISSLKKNKDFSNRLKAIDVELGKYRNLDSTKYVLDAISKMR